MKFIKKKNMQEAEELLYLPRLHWYFVIRHLVRSLPFFIVLAVFLFYFDPGSIPAGSDIIWNYIREGIKYVFPAALAVVLLFFLWSVFQYMGTEYGVTNKRLLMKRGVLRVFTAEIPTDRIEGIYCTQNILGRILNYGTICISGVGGMMPVFYMVARPYAFRRKIVDIIEKNKRITVVHGDMPVPEVKPEPKKIKEEPVYRYGTFVRVLPDGQ